MKTVISIFQSKIIFKIRVSIYFLNLKIKMILIEIFHNCHTRIKSINNLQIPQKNEVLNIKINFSMKFKDLFHNSIELNQL